MKKTFLCSFLALAISCLLFACSASRNQAPAAIGIVPLYNYAMMNGTPAKDTTYRVIESEKIFASVFSATSADVKKPSFNGQTVVAVVTQGLASLQFEKATFIDRTVHVYLQGCTPAPQSGCSTNRFFLAAIPKVGNARSVQFFINREAKSTVDF